MALAFLDILVCEPAAPYALPRGDVLGLPIASTTLSTQMAETTGTPPTVTRPSQPSAIYIIPPAPSGAQYVLARLSSRHAAVVVGFGRGSDPPTPETDSADGAHAMGILVVRDVVTMALKPGDRLIARASNA